MPLSKLDYARIAVLMTVVCVGIVVWLRYFYQHSIAAAGISIMVWGLLGTVILLWSGWLLKQGTLLGVMISLLAGFVASAEWLKGEHIWSAGYAAVFLFGAALFVRRFRG